MTFPSSFYTPNRIIPLALKDAGLLQEGQTPTAETLTDGLHRLADMIALWQTRGLKLWLNELRTVAFVAGQTVYTLPSSPKSMRVIGGWNLQSAGNRFSLTPLSWTDYNNLGNKTTLGVPNSYFVDKQRDALRVSFWPVPADVGTAELLVQRQASAPTSLTEEIAFPTEWYLALRWGLADEYATGQPPLISEVCRLKAREYREALEDWDVEDTPTRFTFNSTYAGIRPSRFR